MKLLTPLIQSLPLHARTLSVAGVPALVCLPAVDPAVQSGLAAFNAQVLLHLVRY